MTRSRKLKHAALMFLLWNALFWWLMFLNQTPAEASVTAALQPSAGTVQVGQNFVVTLRVTQAGSGFNTYQTIIHWDPAKVSLQGNAQGSYMTGACGATFHWYSIGTTEIGVVNSILCGGMSLTGPGDLYVLTFRADAAGTAAFTLPTLDFADAGNPVTPVNSTGTSVTITSGSGGCGHNCNEYEKATGSWATIKGLYR